MALRCQLQVPVSDYSQRYRFETGQTGVAANRVVLYTVKVRAIGA